MKLSTEEIKSICKGFYIENIDKIQKLSKGCANHNWLIVSGAKKYVLRGVNEDKTKSDLNREFKYLNYLSRQGFNYNIPDPIKTRNGLFYIEFKQNLFWAYPFIEGEIINDIFSLNQLKQVASMLSTLHKIIENSELNDLMKNKDFDVNKPINEAEEQIKIALEKKDEFSVYYHTKAREVVKIVRKLTYPDIFTFPIHRDINPENVIFYNDELIGIIDFDNVTVCNEPLVKDIANLFLYSCYKKNNQNQLDLSLAGEFIKNYSKTKKLSVEEISAIPVLSIMGCLEDLNYEYWLYENEPSKTNLSILKKRFETSLWYFENKEKIVKELMECV